MSAGGSMSKGMESTIYELGRILSMSGWSPETVWNRNLLRVDSHWRIKKMVGQLIRSEVFVDEDGRGNGWVVVDESGVSAMPPGCMKKVFEDKGSAFVFWWGLGEPDGYQLVLRCNPRIEADTVFPEENILTIEDAIIEQETRSPLSVVRD